MGISFFGGKEKDSEEFWDKFNQELRDVIYDSLSTDLDSILAEVKKLTAHTIGNAGSAGGAASDVISSLRTQLQEKDQEIQGLKSSIYDKSAELEKYKSTANGSVASAELQKQLAQLENDLQVARNRETELNLKLSDAESQVKSKEEKISQLEASAQNAVSPAALEQREKEIKEQSERIKQLEVQAADSVEWERRYRESQSYLDKTGAELAKVKNEIKAKDANCQDEINKLTDAHRSELERLTSEHQSEIDRLNSDYQSNLDEQKQINENLVADYAGRLNRQAQEHAAAISAKETSLNEYKEAYEKYEIAYQALKEAKEASERRCDELTTQLSDSKQQVVNLEGNIASLNNSLSKSNTANKDLQSKYERLQSQLDATQERAEQSESSVKALLALQNRVFPECLNIEALAPYVGEWRKQLVEATPDPKVLSMLAHIFSWNCAKETAARCPDVPAIIVEKDAITALYNFSRYFFDVLYSQNVDAETAEKVAYALAEYINRELEQTGAKYEVELAYCGDSFDSKVMQPDPRGTSTGEVYMLRSWCIKNRANSSVHVKSLVQLC